jgi:hypothetical protein
MASTKASTAASPAPRKLDLKQAVAIALDYFRGLFPGLAQNNLMLEELEESEDGKYWLVTLGYDLEERLPPMFGGRITRAYKSFKIDNRTGRVLSMKIRTVA